MDKIDFPRIAWRIAGMKWYNFKVTVRKNGQEGFVTVRALSKNDALWRAINRKLDKSYEAISAEKID